MKFLLSVLFICALSTLRAFAEPAVGYIASGSITYPNSVLPSDRRNLNAEASVTQLWTFKDAIGYGDAVIYTTLSAERDTADNNYASKQNVSWGAKLKFRLFKAANLSFGVRYDFDNRDLWGGLYKNLVLTGDYGLWRHLAPAQNGDPMLLSGWANLRYPGGSDASNDGNWVSQGRADLSREIRAFHKGGKSPRLYVFGGLGFGSDSTGFVYNNKVKLDAGARLRWKVAQRGGLNLSLRYLIDRRVISDETHHGPVLGLSWYVPF